MLFDRHEVQLIAITNPDSTVSILLFITKAWNEKLRVAATEEKARQEADLAQAKPESRAGIIRNIAWLQAVIDGYQAEATDEAIEAMIVQAEMTAVSWRRIGPDEVPGDRTFRDAWRDNGKAVGVDMTAARGIHRDRIRAARARLFAAVDGERAKALDAGDTAALAAIGLKAQALRDVTEDPAIEAATTPEALAAVWPAALR